jgi:nicotinamidase-related amidase
VNSTVQTALVKEFNITIVKDCHTTADRPNFKAEQLIDFHNWMWENLTPTKEKICLKSFSDLMD